MLKNITQLETTIAGKVHRYLCDNDSQVDHVIEALVQFLTYTKQIKDAIVAKQAENAQKLDEQQVTDEVKHEAA